MGNSRTLSRKLDLDLIARLVSGTKHPHKPAKKAKKPRAASSYRGARRNAALQARRDAKKAFRVAQVAA